MEPTNPTPSPAVKALIDTLATVDRSTKMIDTWTAALEGLLAQMHFAQESLDARMSFCREALAALGQAPDRPTNP